MQTENCDVVVVGFGNAAQAAAFSAHRGGGSEGSCAGKGPSCEERRKHIV